MAIVMSGLLKGRIAVVIPALDEQDSLPAVLAALPDGLRVIVVDNGSRDRTAQVARDCGVEVVHEPRRGYGSAVLAGIRAASDDPPEVLVVLDADHADDPGLLLELARPILERRADLVLSNRTRTAAPGALNATQRYGNLLAVVLIRAVTGFRYADMGPFRAISWEALQRLELCDPTWGFNVEMQIKAVRRGLRVREVPMPYRMRRAGRSTISGSVRGTLRAGTRILWAVGHYRRG